jgi:catechol 2,3-dioxygenase-like lactoylglutathione lyase family enzyme
VDNDAATINTTPGAIDPDALIEEARKPDLTPARKARRDRWCGAGAAPKPDAAIPVPPAPGPPLPGPPGAPHLLARYLVDRAMARLVGINHVALEVGDIDEALAWYGTLFDFELRGRHGSRMAFIDMGDQFIALSVGRTQPPDGSRHFGLVVDDKEAVRERLRQRGAAVQSSGSLDFRDPWGNHIQVVDYHDIQFTKAAEILRGMKLDGLSKSEQALAELRAKGLSPD